MKITYKSLNDFDIDSLTPIMKKAFDNDTFIHTGNKEDGPFGYDDGSLLKKLINQPNSSSEIILLDNKMIGAYTVILSTDIINLDMLFIDPTYENKGIGSSVLKYMFSKYKNFNTWIVETPIYSKRNIAFYEKNDFKRTENKVYSDGAESIILIKNTTKIGQINIIKYDETRDFDKIINSCKCVGWEKFYTSKMLDYKVALQKSLTYVAYNDDEYCGYIRCLTDEVFTTYCCEIIVDYKYRRYKIGKQLIDKVKEIYPSCRIDVLSDSDDFYLANDFFVACNGMIKI